MRQIPWILKFVGLMTVGVPAVIALFVVLAHVVAILFAPLFFTVLAYAACCVIGYRVRNGYWHDPFLETGESRLVDGKRVKQKELTGLWG